MKRATGIWVLAIAAIALGVGGCGGGRSTDSVDDGQRRPPPAPANLRVDKIGDGEVWLSWDKVPASAVDQIAYAIYRGADGAAPVAVDSTFAASFRDVGLEYETEYTYYVTAIDGGKESLPSIERKGQPLNTLAPLAPTGLRALAHNLSLLAQRTLDISLDWDANVETDLSFYRLYRAVEPGFPIGEGTLRAEVGEPRFVDQEVEIGVFYYYQVTAVDRGGKESPVSGEVGDVPLPQAVLADPVQGALTSSTPTFRWRPVAGARIYQVMVTTSPTSGEISAIPLSSDTTAVFVGRSQAGGRAFTLEKGQIYYWKLIASTREDGQENSVSQVESFKIR